MRTIVVLVSAFLLNIQAKAQELVITHLTGDFYVFTTWQKYDGITFPSNGMYMVTTAGVVMLDMPWDTTQTMPLLDTIAKRHHAKVVMSISTHFHEDRTGAIDILKRAGVKTYSSVYTQDICKTKNEKVAEFSFLNDTSFIIGNHTFITYYPGIGHAPDNIVVWFPKERILYGGCFVKSTGSKGLGNLSDADVEEWKVSVKKTMRKFPKPAYIIPGHQGWDNKHSLEYTLKLLNSSK